MINKMQVSARSNNDPINKKIENIQKERPTEVNIFHANI